MAASRTRNRTSVFLAAVLLTIALLVTPRISSAAPPAGSVIGNQASATYVDSANVTRITTSNTVTTIVQQVGALTLAANGSRYSNPGGTVYYPHVITNTGNGSDSFTLNVTTGSGDFTHTGLAIYADLNADGVPDNSTDIRGTVVGPVAAGRVYGFVVAGSVPVSAATGQSGTLTVSASSTFDNTVSATNTDTTTVTSNGVVTVTKSMSLLSAAPGTTGITVTLTYTNTGNNTATSVRLTDLLPSGLVYTPGSGRWSTTGTTTLTDADATDLQGTAPNQIIYDYNVTAASTVTAVISQVSPGQSGTLSFQVSVSPTATPGSLLNTATYSYDPDGGGGTPPTSPTPTNGVTLTVTQTASVVANGSGTSSTNGDGEPVTVASALQGATVTFTDYLWNLGNGTDSFDLTLGSSTFPAGTTFILFKGNGTTPLVDTTSNGIPDSGPVPAGSVVPVVVKATLPVTATGGPYTVTLTATSSTNGAVSDTVVNRLNTIVPSTVDLTYATARTDSTPAGTAAAANAATTGFGAGPEAAPVATLHANPGQSSTFVLVVNNTSASPDTYDLAASTDATFATTTLPAGYSVVFKADGGSRDCSSTAATITNTGVVANGANTVVCAIVTTAAGATAGSTDIHFRSQSPTTGSSDTLHTTLTVDAVRSLSITPNNNNQIFPGGTTVFKHTITNTGNVIEGDGTASTVTLSTTDAPSPAIAGWSSQIYWDRNNDGVLDTGDPVVTTLAQLTGGTGGSSTAAGLDPGESATIFVKVQAPAGANSSDTNTTTLSATTTNGTHPTPAPAIATATDISSVINGQVTLLKEQALDPTCTGSGAFSYTTANLSTGALPGTCIRYRITATNVGAAPVTSLVISDSTPANSTYDDGSRNARGGACGSGAVDAPAATTVGTVTAPSCNGAGSVTATIGTLAPGQSAVITFGVMIDN